MNEEKIQKAEDKKAAQEVVAVEAEEAATIASEERSDEAGKDAAEKGSVTTDEQAIEGVSTDGAREKEEVEPSDGARGKEEVEPSDGARGKEAVESSDGACGKKEADPAGEVREKKETEPADGAQAKAEAPSPASGVDEKEQEASTGAKKRGKAAALTAAALVFILAAIGYFGTATFYRTHFLPDTIINGETCDNRSVSEITPLLEAQMENYALTVTGRNPETGEQGYCLGTIRPGDIAMAYVDTAAALEDVLAEQNALFWPVAYLKKQVKSYSVVQGVTFDGELLRKQVGTWDACQAENMKVPQAASISEYREEIGGFEVIPAEKGTALDMEVVFQWVEASLHMQATALDLEEKLCYQETANKSTEQELQEAVDTANRWLSTKITYDWNGSEVVLDVETLKEWVMLGEEGAMLDKDAVIKFVKDQAKEYDTYGKKKKFVTALGITLELASPNYGWKTDTAAEAEELLRLIGQGSQKKREPVYARKAANKGEADWGSSYVEADLTNQHLYVYEKGEMVFESDFVSGTMNADPGSMTPEGIFALTYKKKDAVLRGADYESFVYYWMPFYGNYGLHDASWRANFGGAIYLENGSHGCINLPVPAAEVVYGYVNTGSPIVCYYYSQPEGETTNPAQ